MFNFYMVSDTIWEDENNNIEVHPTIVAFVSLSEYVDFEDYTPASLGSSEDIGKIYIGGELYANPSEVPQ